MSMHDTLDKGGGHIACHQFAGEAVVTAAVVAVVATYGWQQLRQAIRMKDLLWLTMTAAFC